jgi:hypothetical protein
MKKELMTMEEKKKLDPKELMENGLTREENERFDQQTSNFSVFISLIVVGLSCYSIYLVMSI